MIRKKYTFLCIQYLIIIHKIADCVLRICRDIYAQARPESFSREVCYSDEFYLQLWLSLFLEQERVVATCSGGEGRITRAELARVSLCVFTQPSSSMSLFSLIFSLSSFFFLDGENERTSTRVEQRDGKQETRKRRKKRKRDKMRIEWERGKKIGEM